MALNCSAELSRTALLFSAWSQEEWQTVGVGLKMPMKHQQFGSALEIRFANVQFNPRPDDDRGGDYVRQQREEREA